MIVSYVATHGKKTIEAKISQLKTEEIINQALKKLILENNFF